MADNTKEPIAIVGMACRFPGGANSPDEFWDALLNGRDLVSEIEDERWNKDYFRHPRRDEPGRSYTWRAGVLDNYRDFDADFFGISPREAEQMDPQQRLMLELVWEAIEDGGFKAEQLAGAQVGVYVGVSSNDFATSRSDDPSAANAYFMTGSALSIVANRISYIYDLHGPSMAIDTACSSSLVALHQACQSVWTGESKMAVCGGVNVLLSPFSFAGFSKASMLSPEGYCRAFDANGQGYVRAEGGGVVLLKPLSQALADGDRVMALVRGSGVNSDGRTTGIALPSSRAQEALLRQVYDEAGIDLAEVDYVEAHGTGTMAGDPQEAGALGRAFGPVRKKGHPLLVGSVKTNIGHLESGAGMAGLIKAAMILRNREIPPSLHFKDPNPNIPFDEYKLKVVGERLRVEDDRGPLVVGINSFGFGGTNGHVVLEEHRPAENDQARRRIRHRLPPLFLSARSNESLAALAGKYRERLDGINRTEFYDLAWSTAHKRDLHSHRVAVRADDLDGFMERLDMVARGETGDGIVGGQVLGGPVKIALMFSGNGSQWFQMGRDLWEKDARFRKVVMRVNNFFEKRAGWSIPDMLQTDFTEDDKPYEKTEIAQPVLFAIQVALLKMFLARGIRPAAVFGHSVGEVAAAFASGALHLPHAVRVIHERSLAQEKTRGAGKMAAVGLSADKAAREIAVYDGKVEIAAYNSPDSVTLSGPQDLLEDLRERLAAKEVFCRILDLDYAFHSKAMDPIKEDLLTGLKGLKVHHPTIPFVSTVTGDYADENSLGASYWWDNIRKPVRFGDAIDRLVHDGCNLFLEIGPHAIMQTYVVETLRAADSSGRPVGTMRRGGNEMEQFEDTVSTLFTLGAKMDFDWAFPVEGQAVPLPSYPWHRQTHWFTSTSEQAGFIHGKRLHPLLGYRFDGDENSWINFIDTELLPYLDDHKVDGAVIFPAAGFIEMALGVGALQYGDDRQTLLDFEIRRPLMLEDGQAKTVRLELSPEDGSFEIRSRQRLSDDPWIQHAVGRLGGREQGRGRTVPPLSAKHNKGQLVDADSHYAQAREVGLDYGPAFQSVTEIRVDGRTATAKLALPAIGDGDHGDYILPPALLDGGFQVLIAILTGQGTGNTALASSGVTYLPSRVGRLRTFGGGADAAGCVVTLTKVAPRSVVADLLFHDEAGDPVAELTDCRFLRMESKRHRDGANALYHWRMEPQPHPGGRRPAPMSAPGILASSVQQDLARRIRDDHDGDGPENLLGLFDALAAAIAHETIKKFRIPEFTLKSLMHMGRVDEEFGAHLAFLLTILEEDGLVERDGETFRLVEDTDLPDSETIWRLILAEYPAYLPEIVMASRSHLNLVEVMRGQRSPASILPGRWDSGVVEHYFEDSGTVRTAMLATELLIERLAESWPEDRRLRILEVDGGSGGLAGRLIPRLPAERCDYVVTDNDDQALGHLENLFKGSSFVQARRLDPSRDFVEQDFNEDGFDIVILDNTLHGTNDLGGLLARLKRVLAQGGLLLVTERTPERLTDVIFGVTPGWWRVGEDPLRPQSSLMTVEEMLALMEAAGFDDCRALPADSDADTTLSYLVIAQQGQVELEETAPPAEKRWLILCDDTGESRALAENLEIALNGVGQDPLIAVARPGLDGGGEGLLFDPLDPGSVGRLLNAPGRLDGIIHLVGLTGDIPDMPEDQFAAQDLRAGLLVHLVRAMDNRKGPGSPHLWVVTSGAQAVPESPVDPNPGEAALWGLARVLMNEQPHLGCRLVDLQEQSDPLVTGRLLADEMVYRDPEDEVVLWADSRFVPRLDDADPGTPRDAKRRAPAAIALGFDNPGPLSHLNWREESLKPPAGDEIRIAVKATGLNFRDVMWAMGMLPDEAVENGFAGPTLGMECAGIVEAVGPDVADFRVGDEVLAFAPACFASHVTTRVTAVAAKPDSMTFEEAATIPGAFFTAYYALGHLARLEAGEKVLIHGAAGGVGIAAIQYAAHCGAEIFATAGSDEKRDFLRMLGVDHVLDSRSLTFADEILERTGGTGVDVVLNSLAGEALIRSLGILKPFGRFLELGKRDFFANSRVGLRPFRNNISYFGIDADQLLTERPDLAGRLFTQMMDLFHDQVFRPLPHRVFRRVQAVDAFRTMQHSRHIGKIIVAMDETERQVRRLEKRFEPVKMRKNASYLITGGFGGFGLETAHWLAAKGARSLILMSRSGAGNAAAKKAVKALEAQGVTVHAVKADVSDEAAVTAALDALPKDLPPLKGVIHTAMVIDDGLISNLDRDRLATVLRPKAVGAWVLHRLTRDMGLDFFVLYSSATTHVGSPGQGSYVAANAYLEALAEYRQRQGLPGLAVSWGAISDVGYLARNEEVRDALSGRLGRNELTSAQALELLDRVMASDLTNVAAIELDWRTLGSALPTAKSPKYSILRRRHEESGRGGDQDSVDVRAMIAGMSEDEAGQVITDLVSAEVAEILGTSADKLDLEKPVTEMGMDSLMALELRMSLEERFGIQLPMMALAEGATIKRLVARVTKSLMGDGQDGAVENDIDALVHTHGEVVDKSELNDILGDVAKSQEKRGSKLINDKVG